MKTKTFIVVITLISIFLTGCESTVQNGAKIISINNKETLILPSPPRGHIYDEIIYGRDLDVIYWDTISKSFLKIKYYECGKFGGTRANLYGLQISNPGDNLLITRE